MEGLFLKADSIEWGHSGRFTSPAQCAPMAGFSNGVKVPNGDAAATPLVTRRSIRQLPPCLVSITSKRWTQYKGACPLDYALDLVRDIENR